jgi:hypothetical protein
MAKQNRKDAPTDFPGNVSPTESIAEGVVPEWFGELGRKRVKREIGRVKSWSSLPVSLFTLHSSPSLSALCDRRLVGRLREAIRRLNLAIPEEARATAKDSLSVQNPSKGG